MLIVAHQPSNFAAAFGLKIQELDVDLDMVPGNLLRVATGVDGPSARILRQPSHPVTDEDTVNTRAEDLDAMVPL